MLEEVVDELVVLDEVVEDEVVDELVVDELLPETELDEVVELDVLEEVVELEVVEELVELEDVQEVDDEVESAKGTKKPSRVYKQVELVEVSQVLVPANPAALQKWVQAKSVDMEDPIIKELIAEESGDPEDKTPDPEPVVPEPEVTAAVPEPEPVVEAMEPAVEPDHQEHHPRRRHQDD